MKTLKLTSHMPSVKDLLRMAQKDIVLMTTDDGDSFAISSADDFKTEVQLLRQNHTFLTMLDDFKSEEEIIPLNEVEKKLW